MNLARCPESPAMADALHEAQYNAQLASRQTGLTMYVIRGDGYFAATRRAHHGERELQRWEGGRCVWDCAEGARRMVDRGETPDAVVNGVLKELRHGP